MSTLLAGVAMYYLQVYAFYDEISAVDQEIALTSLFSGEPEPILYENFSGIDSDSSPIRYRACFSTTSSLALLTETYVIVDEAEPLVAPSWFNCFDAEAIGADLETGTAIAFMGTENIAYGIDRVIAVMPDGRGFAWHQINSCGEVVFDGEDAPADCPPKPEG